MPKTKKVETTVVKTENTTAVSKTNSSRKAYTRRTVNISVQFGGMDWKTDELTEHAIATWVKGSGQKKTAAKDIRLYIKPEENAVYYVINGDPGSFALS